MNVFKSKPNFKIEIDKQNNKIVYKIHKYFDQNPASNRFVSFDVLYCTSQKRIFLSIRMTDRNRDIVAESAAR